jgi:hypothetical protein
MSDQDLSKEEIILSLVKRTLTTVVKDTATAPGMMHPLKDETIGTIRECLRLISEREQELAEVHNRDMSMRPRFKDEPRKQSEVVVPLHKTGLVKDKNKTD